jgi:hypothetical protein
VTATDASGETIQEARTVHHDPELRAATDRPHVRRSVSAPFAGRLLAWLPGLPGLVVVGDAGDGMVAQADRAASLEMALAEPRDQARVDQDSIALAGVVRSAKGVSRVLVTVNGREVGRLDEPASPRSLAMNFPLTLREGRNTIVVTATETDGTHYQEVRAVHYERAVPLQVAIRYPEDRARVTDEVTVLAAVLTATRPDRAQAHAPQPQVGARPGRTIPSSSSSPATARCRWSGSRRDATRRGLPAMRLGEWWRARRARLGRLWAVGLAASLAATAASALGYLEPLQTRALDLWLKLGGPRPAGGIVIVAVDDHAFQALGRRQPVPREYLAAALGGPGVAQEARPSFNVSFAGEMRVLVRQHVRFPGHRDTKSVLLGFRLQGQPRLLLPWQRAGHRSGR